MPPNIRNFIVSLFGASTVLNKFIMFLLNSPAIYRSRTVVMLIAINRTMPYITDFIILLLFDLCPKIMPKYPHISMNINSKISIIAITATTALAFISRSVATGVIACFTNSKFAFVPYAITMHAKIIVNESSIRIIPVNTFDKNIVPFFTGNVCVK